MLFFNCDLNNVHTILLHGNRDILLADFSQVCVYYLILFGKAFAHVEQNADVVDVHFGEHSFAQFAVRLRFGGDFGFGVFLFFLGIYKKPFNSVISKTSPIAKLTPSFPLVLTNAINVPKVLIDMCPFIHHIFIDE